MNLRLRERWRNLPPRTRIRILATVGLLLLGTEAAILAPQVFELAVMVDAIGVTFLLGVFARSAQLRLLWATSQAQSLWHRRSAGLLFAVRNFRFGTILALLALGCFQHFGGAGQ